MYFKTGHSAHALRDVSACIAAVKCRPVLHHCVVIFLLVLRDHGWYVVYI